MNTPALRLMVMDTVLHCALCFIPGHDCLVHHCCYMSGKQNQYVATSISWINAQEDLKQTELFTSFEVNVLFFTVFYFLETLL